MITTDKFLKIEKKYHMTNKEYQNFHYWTYSRYAIFNYIQKMQNGLNMSNVNLKQGLLSGVFKLFWNSIRFFICKPSNADICIFNHERKIKNENYYECIYTDDIASYFQSSITIERPYKYKHFNPIKTKKIFYSDWWELSSLTYALFECAFKMPEYRKARSYFEINLKQITIELEDAYNVDLNYYEIVEIVTRLYLLYKIKRREITKTLKLIKPSLILEVVSYNLDCMIVNEIAKKEKITTIELQHGIMGEQHIAYNYNDGECIAQFPDKVFTFSEYWNKNTKLPLDTSNVIAVGYPYMDKKKKIINTNEGKKENKKVILFLSQWNIAKELSQIAIGLQNLLNEDDFRIIYKLHPEEYDNWKKECPWLLNSQIEVIDSLRYSIYDCFAISDIQIGVYSTAIYEGLAFGLDTFIYDMEYSFMMKPLVESGYAAMFKTESELYSLLKLKEEKKEKIQISNYFWKENAIDNIKNQIDMIMNEQ